MLIFPAIDIRGGKCVRLLKGDFARETVFFPMILLLWHGNGSSRGLSFCIWLIWMAHWLANPKIWQQ